MNTLRLEPLPERLQIGGYFLATDYDVMRVGKMVWLAILRLIHTIHTDA